MRYTYSYSKMSIQPLNQNLSFLPRIDECMLTSRLDPRKNSLRPNFLLLTREFNPSSRKLITYDRRSGYITSSFKPHEGLRLRSSSGSGLKSQEVGWEVEEIWGYWARHFGGS